ncbi:MAG: hypothetical protein ABI382_06560 [Nakamurella sp.]
MTFGKGGAGGARRGEIAGRRGAQSERTNITPHFRENLDDVTAAAVVVAVVAQLTVSDHVAGMTTPPPRSVWTARPSRLGSLPQPGPHAWWATGVLP